MSETNKYSRYIDFILRWMSASGVHVDTQDTTIPEFSGRCFNHKDDGYTLICVNCPTAREALLILAHEVGHWFGNEVTGHKETKDEREEQAYEYGWRALLLVGADAVVTHAEWRVFHEKSPCA